MKLQASTLANILSATSGPALTWLEPISQLSSGQARSRVELGGPVARRWVAKTDNFLDSEFPFGATQFVANMTQHWRTPFWIATAWLRGLEMRPIADGVGVDLAVSTDLYYLEALQEEGGPDVLVVQSTDSFAFAWPTDLPFGITDGTADVLSFGDEVENPLVANQDSYLLGEGVGWHPPGSALTPGTRPRLKDLLTVDYLGLGEVGQVDARPHTSAGSVIAEAGAGPAPSAKPEDAADQFSRLDGHRVLVTTVDNALFTAQMIQLWLRGASVVWVPGGGEDLERIAAQESVTLRIAP